MHADMPVATTDFLMQSWDMLGFEQIVTNIPILTGSSRDNDNNGDPPSPLCSHCSHNPVFVQQPEKEKVEIAYYRVLFYLDSIFFREGT